MKIVVLGHGEQWEALKKTNPEIEWLRAEDAIDLFETKDANAYFNLEDDSAEFLYEEKETPIFINSVTATLSEKNFTKNIVRLNGWPGFIDKEKWELAGQINEDAKKIFSALNKSFVVVRDEPGFVSARVIAMIINEAFFAKGENISSEFDIDIAMKLGTNYPYGPFEWSKKIGLKNICTLLEKLSVSDPRYTPAPEMKKALPEIV